MRKLCRSAPNVTVTINKNIIKILLPIRCQNIIKIYITYGHILQSQK